MSSPTPPRAEDGIEKHPECLEVYGECPHWLVDREQQVLQARLRGVSRFEFMHREASIAEFLEAVIAADAIHGDRPRRSLVDEVDRLIDYLEVDRPTIEELEQRRDDEVARDDVRQPVVGLLNTIIQRRRDKD